MPSFSLFETTSDALAVFDPCNNENRVQLFDDKQDALALAPQLRTSKEINAQLDSMPADERTFYEASFTPDEITCARDRIYSVLDRQAVRWACGIIGKNAKLDFKAADAKRAEIANSKRLIYVCAESLDKLIKGERAIVSKDYKRDKVFEGLRKLLESKNKAEAKKILGNYEPILTLSPKNMSEGNVLKQLESSKDGEGEPHKLITTKFQAAEKLAKDEKAPRVCSRIIIPEKHELCFSDVINAVHGWGKIELENVGWIIRAGNCLMDLAIK